MKESPFYQEIKAEGRDEGRDEGRKETRRADTLANLEERFGAQAAAQVADAVNALHDLAELDRLHRLASRCAGIDEFRQALQTTEPPQTAPRARRSPRSRR